MIFSFTSARLVFNRESRSRNRNRTFKTPPANMVMRPSYYALHRVSQLCVQFQRARKSLMGGGHSVIPMDEIGGIK